MKEVTLKVYRLNELSEKIQKKVIEKYRDFNTQDTFWSDQIIDSFKDKLENFGFENVEINFSGFYSQGDGASFDAEVNLEKVLKNAPEQFKKLIIAKNCIICEIIKTSFANRYSHERTIYVNCNFEYFGNLRKCENSVNLLIEFEKWLESERLSKSKEIYKELEKEYDLITSDETIKQNLIENNYYFFENGDFYEISEE